MEVIVQKKKDTCTYNPDIYMYGRRTILYHSCNLDNTCYIVFCEMDLDILVHLHHSHAQQSSVEELKNEVSCCI